MRRRLLVLGPVLPASLAGAARAHGTRAGDLLIEHAYALPSTPGATEGCAYLRALTNRGRTPDRLLGARSPAAASVELQRQGQAVAAIELPPGAALALRHDGEWCLRLKGLKAPLVIGQRFTLQLRFAQAGEVEVMAWVQQPRAAAHAH